MYISPLVLNENLSKTFHTSVENINIKKVTKKHHEKIFMTSCLPEPIYFQTKNLKLNLKLTN